MDLLHTRTLGGLCLVSSDSDFTRLATRIREDGLRVFGFGEQKTTKSLIAACDRFIYTEIFKPKPAESSAKSAPTESKPLRDLARDEGFQSALDQSVEAAMTDGNRAHLGLVGNHLLKLLPDFDPRSYGFEKLSELVLALPEYRIARERTASGNSVAYVERANG
jgi:hypothetical protein